MIDADATPNSPHSQKSDHAYALIGMMLMRLPVERAS